MDELPHVPSPPIQPSFWLVLLVAAFLSSSGRPTPAPAAELTNPADVTAPWGDVPRPVLGTWFESLHREGLITEDSDGEPDTGSCCGLGDAYEADIFDTATDGFLYATITDGREFCFKKGGLDNVHCRKEIKEGTRVYIPNSAVVSHQGNPTGHGVVFISQSDLKSVYCFVIGAGG